MAKKSPIVRAAKYPNLTEHEYLLKDAKVGDRYRRRDGRTATLVYRMQNGRYTSNYFITDDDECEEYGVLWDGMYCWGFDKKGDPIKTDKDIIEKIELTMTEQELDRQQQLIDQERAYINVRKTVTTMRCPVCGQPLHGYCTEPEHDTLVVTPHIVCTTGCKLIHYRGKAKSLYARQPEGARYTKASILESAIPDVRAWVKQFGSALEEDY